MRIISGSARGRKLCSPPGRSLVIRPTSDRAREALFNILGRRTEEAAVLDLYAGTGALGLEAFSRGAKRVLFVDNNRLALDLIARNIRACAGTDESTSSASPAAAQPRLSLINHDLRRGLPLRQYQQKGFSLFDLIFLDPPYSQGLCQRTLQDLDHSHVLADAGLLIAEERENEMLDDSFATFKLSDRRVYGDTAFWIFESKEPDNE
ncbi:MAG: 16S rRNA (guanine(966)-N(2))-methyltransferase RsmD [Desulfoprunum sp.]|uniref:16S rRNA (guanine(966)-N(2))-methyltransferase RsmD n=1 Tax=Desulfoprunum sp. TaxID=2020866 RepID=UPI003C74E330